MTAGIDRLRSEPAAAPVVTIARAGPRHRDDFLRLVAASGLPSFADPGRAAALFDRAEVFGAFASGAMVGCCCLDRDVMKSYRADGRVKTTVTPNAFLCGTFVAPQHRGQGVGSLLLAHRLEVATRPPHRPLLVELLGTGTPNSVAPLARMSLRFYLHHGFDEIGYSTDPDRGKVLYRSPDSRTL